MHGSCMLYAHHTTRSEAPALALRPSASGSRRTRSTQRQRRRRRRPRPRPVTLGMRRQAHYSASAPRAVTGCMSRLRRFLPATRVHPSRGDRHRRVMRLVAGPTGSGLPRSAARAVMMVSEPRRRRRPYARTEQRHGDHAYGPDPWRKKFISAVRDVIKLDRARTSGDCAQRLKDGPPHYYVASCWGDL
jgi:hypothetical protein